MDNRKPMELSGSDWVEIFDMDEVIQCWGMNKNENTLEDFKSSVYAVKFDYVNETPGYVGDFYIIMGSAMMMPIFLTRHNGVLEVTELDT
jgi:hypothetical protein